jgi:hypothetical protein
MYVMLLLLMVVDGTTEVNMHMPNLECSCRID